MLKSNVVKDGVEIAEGMVEEDMAEEGEVDKMDDGTKNDNERADEGEVEERDDDKEKVMMRDHSPQPRLRRLVIDKLMSEDKEEKALDVDVTEEQVVGSVEGMEDQVLGEVTMEGVKILSPNDKENSEEVEQIMNSFLLV